MCVRQNFCDFGPSQMTVICLYSCLHPALRTLAAQVHLWSKRPNVWWQLGLMRPDVGGMYMGYQCGKGMKGAMCFWGRDTFSKVANSRRRVCMRDFQTCLMHNNSLIKLPLYQLLVADLWMLQGLPLSSLNISGCHFATLEHLKGLPIADLNLVACTQLVDACTPLVFCYLKSEWKTWFIFMIPAHGPLQVNTSSNSDWIIIYWIVEQRLDALVLCLLSKYQLILALSCASSHILLLCEFTCWTQQPAVF